MVINHLKPGGTYSEYIYDEVFHKLQFLFVPRTLYNVARCVDKNRTVLRRRAEDGASSFFPEVGGGSSTQAWMPTYVSILRIPQMI
jgi:hypothetical protein